MKKHITKFLILFVLVVVYSTNSCKVDDLLPPDPQATQDAARAEDAIADAFGICSDAVLSNTGAKYLGNDCHVKQFQAGNFIITLPEPGCSGSDGTIRKGKLIGTFAAGIALRFAQSTFTVGDHFTFKFDNFYSKGSSETAFNKLTGEFKIEYLGFENNNGVLIPKFNISTYNNDSLRIYFSDGKKITMKINYTIYWLEGFRTLTERGDDSFKINGTMAGKNRGGGSLIFETVNVISKATCKYPISGELKITEDNKECTLQFTNTKVCAGPYYYITKEGKKFEIKLP